MGLLDLFASNNNIENTATNTPPKELFVEEHMDVQHLAEDNSKDIDSVYRYINSDFSLQGYDNAVVNQSIENRDLNLKALELKLKTKIEQSINFYESNNLRINNKIESSKRMGLIDLVQDLTIELKINQNSIEKLEGLNPNIKDENNVFSIISNSYKSGFHNAVTELAQEITTKKQ